MVSKKSGSGANTSGAALNYQQLLQSSLISARKRQETSIRLMVAVFGLILLASLQPNGASAYRDIARLMCAVAIGSALLGPSLISQANRIANVLGQHQMNGELLVCLITGTLLVPAMLLSVFVLPTPQHWFPLLALALAIICLASISDAHPMRVVFLISPMIVAIITSLSWAGEPPDLLLALVFTGIVFTTMIWLRQRHRHLMTGLIARVNEQMVPIRLERQIAAQQRELEELTLQNRSDWQDLEQPLLSIASLAHQLESGGPGNAGTARSLVRTSRFLSECIHQHSAGPTQTPEARWTSVGDLFEGTRLRLIASTQSSGARLHFDPLAVDVEAVPGLLERTLQNLIFHSIVDASAGSILVRARFVNQALALTVEHDGQFSSLDMLAPDLARTGLPRALALARSAGLAIGVEQNQRTVFTLLFEHWRKRPGRAILQPRNAKEALADVEPTTKCRTLLIDDDPLARMGLAALLEQAGYDTIIWNGQSTDSIRNDLAEAGISFIVSDWWLSKNANAVAMLEWVQRHLPAPVPVVIVSGDKASLDAPAISAQLDDIAVRTLAKPVTPKTLSRAISELIELDRHFNSSNR